VVSPAFIEPGVEDESECQNMAKEPKGTAGPGGADGNGREKVSRSCLKKEIAAWDGRERGRNDYARGWVEPR